MYYYVIGGYIILKAYEYIGIVETLYTAGKGVKYIVDWVIIPLTTHKKEKKEKKELIENLDWILIQN